MNNSYQLEFQIFIRNKAAWAGILILLVSGFLGLYFGKQFISRQQTVIEKAAKLQQEHTNTNLQYFSKDLGLLLFYNKFSVANIPDNWAAFANGERDINPYLISVTILGLEGQLYDTDLYNPSTLLLGNMDLSFVIIYLFPLVIIAFSYNLLSAEQESGIWSLVRSQSALPLKVIWQKLLLRMAVVFAVLLILMTAALVYLQLAVDFRFLSIFSLITLYLLFWFALSFCVTAACKSSSFNAVALIAFWVVLNVISPAVVNVWLTYKYPVPEALENVVKQREGYHEKWDLDKKETMDSFYSHYPQFKKYPFPAELTFSWYWYYAMQQMGDDDAAASAAKMSEKLQQRQQFSDFCTLLLPGTQTQLGLNSLAGSDLQHHLEFLQAIRTYHEQLRLSFYPAIFTDKTADSIRWDQFKMKLYPVKPTGSIRRNGFTLMLFTVLLTAAAFYNFRKKLQQV